MAYLLCHGLPSLIRFVPTLTPTPTLSHQWAMLSHGKPSGRDTILHNIDPIYRDGQNSSAIRQGPCKFMLVLLCKEACCKGM